MTNSDDTTAGDIRQHTGEEDPLRWVAATGDDTQTLLLRAHELAQARAAMLGVPVPGPDGREIAVLVDEAGQVLSPELRLTRRQQLLDPDVVHPVVLDEAAVRRSMFPSVDGDEA